MKFSMLQLHIDGHVTQSATTLPTHCAVRALCTEDQELALHAVELLVTMPTIICAVVKQ